MTHIAKFGIHLVLEASRRPQYRFVELASSTCRGTFVGAMINGIRDVDASGKNIYQGEQ